MCIAGYTTSNTAVEGVTSERCMARRSCTSSHSVSIRPRRCPCLSPSVTRSPVNPLRQRIGMSTTMRSLRPTSGQSKRLFVMRIGRFTSNATPCIRNTPGSHEPTANGSPMATAGSWPLILALCESWGFHAFTGWSFRA